MDKIISEQPKNNISESESSMAKLGNTITVTNIVKGIKFIFAAFGALLGYFLIPIFNPFIISGYLIKDIFNLEIGFSTFEKYYIYFPNIVLNIVIYFLAGQMVENLILKKKFRLAGVIAIMFILGGAIIWLVYARYFHNSPQ